MLIIFAYEMCSIPNQTLQINCKTLQYKNQLSILVLGCCFKYTALKVYTDEYLKAKK